MNKYSYLIVRLRKVGVNDLLSKKVNTILKNSFVVLVAGVFTFSSSLAFANEQEVKVEEYDVVSTQENNNSGSDLKVTEEAVGDVETGQVDSEAPSLLPGDFFYFAKIAIEKIKLAFTFDDVKEAELLATYTTARLAEIEALLAEGKEELALETIETALQYFERIGEAVKDEEVIADDGFDEEVIVEENSEETTDETEQNEDEVTTEDNEIDVTTEEEENETIVDENEPKDEENIEEQDPVEEIGKHVARNIIALQAAMERVKNPVAKAALQKNIDKSYAKLAKKIAKFENWCVKFEEKTNEEDQLEDVTDENELVNKETGDTELSNNDATENENIEPEDEGKTNLSVVTAPKESKQASKQHDKQVKQHEKQLKENAKQEKKQAKQAEKTEKQQLKQMEKQAKEQLKQLKKQQYEDIKVKRQEQKSEAKQKRNELKGTNSGQANENKGNGSNKGKND